MSGRAGCAELVESPAPGRCDSATGKTEHRFTLPTIRCRPQHIKFRAFPRALLACSPDRREHLP